jgi:Family of unknown function (DUF6444)
LTGKPLDAARDALTGLRGQLIAMIAAQNAALAARVAELEAANVQLSARLERLERAASQNSGSSSLPPSLDDHPGRTPPPGRGKRGKGKDPIRASSRDRRGRTWPGVRTRPGRCRISRGGRARAARIWPARPISGCR